MGSVFFGRGLRLLFHCWVITLPIHLTVINYKIFVGKYNFRVLLADHRESKKFKTPNTVICYYNRYFCKHESMLKNHIKSTDARSCSSHHVLPVGLSRVSPRSEVCLPVTSYSLPFTSWVVAPGMLELSTRSQDLQIGTRWTLALLYYDGKNDLFFINLRIRM